MVRKAVIVAAIALTLALPLAGWTFAGGAPGAAIPPASPGDAVNGSFAVVSRRSLDPGRDVVLGATDGPVVAAFLEAGASVAVTRGEARLVAAGSTSSRSITPGEGLSVIAGDVLVIGSGGKVRVAGAGAAPVPMLIATITTGHSPSTPVAGTPEFGDPIAVPENVTQVSLTWIAIAKDAAVPLDGGDRPRVIAVQSGAVAALPNPGRCRVLRAGGSSEFVTAGSVDPAAFPTLDPSDSEDREAIEAQGGATQREAVGSPVGLETGDTALLEAGGNWSIRGVDPNGARVAMLTFGAGPFDLTPTASH